MSWRRTQTRVRAQLQEDAERTPTTIDLVMGRRWGTAGLMAAAAVALLVWFAPRPSAPPTPVAVSSSPLLRRVLTQAAPVDLMLSTGIELQLGPQGRLDLQSSVGASVHLTLVAGALNVHDLRPPAATRPIRVNAAPYSFSASHADFVVTRLSSGAQLEVQRGEVTVARGQDRAVRIQAGENRTFSTGVSSPLSEAPSANVTPAPPAAALVPVAAVVPNAAVVPAQPIPSDNEPLPEPPASVVSQPAETQVVMESPADPIADLLRQANHAYFRAGDLERTVELATQVRGASPGPIQDHAALELLCNAYTSLKQAEHALRTCNALLQTPRNAAARRVLHQQIAEIHRVQMGDCVSAIEHYNQVLVFGRSTPLHDDARWRRAECAVQVGDFTLAERDLTQLEASPTFRRTNALKALRAKISASRRAQVRGGATDKR